CGGHNNRPGGNQRSRNGLPPAVGVFQALRGFRRSQVRPKLGGIKRAKIKYETSQENLEDLKMKDDASKIFAAETIKAVRAVCFRCKMSENLAKACSS
uniref:Uncharacterized protein n=1 Tax=Romanomermis culicivorax TaxID=13658 RepID=A0A915KL23_ROMCU